MKDYNEVFGYEAFAGVMTAAQLKRHTECIREYKGYSIAFGKYQRDAQGRAWWSVRVWKNDGKDRLGAFTMKGLCATDGEAMVLLLSWIVTNLLSYVVTNLSDKSACICQKYIFNRLIALFMRIPHGCQGRQRRLYSLDSHVEYAYTLAAIDKLESKEGHFTHNPVKVPKIPPLLRV